MASVKSGINKVGNNYYQSITADQPDGSVGTTLFRVNADGSGPVPLYNVDKPGGTGTPVKTFEPNATAEEKRLLSDPNSQLSQVRSQQVTSSNPYANPSPTQRSTLAQAGGGSGNTATAATNPNAPAANQNAAQASGDQQSGDLSLEELQEGVKDDESKIRQKYGNWVYPIDMRSTKQDRIKFTMYRYFPKKFDPSGVATGNAFAQKRDLKSPMGSVTLPVQPTISDTNTVGWGETPMDAGAQAFTGTALASIAEGGEGTSKVVGGITPGTTAGAKTVVATTLAEKAAGVQGGGLLTRLTGGIVNTNLELLFTGPALRSFSFTFSMSAREPKEAQEIRNIIRLFKQGMSVKRATTNLFLMSPNIFTIRYLHNGTDKDHPWINKIKECALTSCSVNYTPEGNYATYEDGAMTKYDVTLSFTELDFIYDDDYGNGGGAGPDTEIGY